MLDMTCKVKQSLIAYYLRQISEQESKELAAQWHCPSVEASAKHNENISKY
jgi:hypothetical protein